MPGWPFTAPKPIVGVMCNCIILKFRIWKNWFFLHSPRDCPFGEKFASIFVVSIVGGVELGVADDRYFGVRFLIVTKQ